MRRLYNLFSIIIPTNRVFGLDLLRAVAIITVLIGHSVNLLPSELVGAVSFLYIDGVSIFFVLSGFLIGTILIKALNRDGASRKTLFRFWQRRWFRTLPAYFFVLFLLYVFQCFVQHQIPRLAFLPYLFFVQNLASPISKNFFLESWSLAVEEWFYLLTPLIICGLIVFLKASVKKSLALTALIVIVAVTAFRYYRYSHYPPTDYHTWDILFRKLVVTRLDASMFGVVGAYLAYYYPTRWLRHKTLLFGLGCVTLVALQVFMLLFFITNLNAFSCVFLFTVSSLAALCLLPYLSEWSSASRWISRPITVVSLVSYSLYLLNLTILTELVNPIPGTYPGVPDWLISLLKFALFWVLCFLLASLQYKFIELPTTQLRDSFTGRFRFLFRPSLAKKA